MSVGWKVEGEYIDISTKFFLSLKELIEDPVKGQL